MDIAYHIGLDQLWCNIFYHEDQIWLQSRSLGTRYACNVENSPRITYDFWTNLAKTNFRWLPAYLLLYEKDCKVRFGFEIASILGPLPKHIWSFFDHDCNHIRSESLLSLQSYLFQPYTLITTDFSYMIDNVCLLINGTLNRRQLSELVPKCHPLGRFEQMEAVTIAQDRSHFYLVLMRPLVERINIWEPIKTPGELYNSILIDTPLSEFFSGFSEADLDEMNIEIIRNTLFKVSFFYFEL